MGSSDGAFRGAADSTSRTRALQRHGDEGGKNSGPVVAQPLSYDSGSTHCPGVHRRPRPVVVAHRGGSASGTPRAPSRGEEGPHHRRTRGLRRRSEHGGTGTPGRKEDHDERHPFRGRTRRATPHQVSVRRIRPAAGIKGSAPAGGLDEVVGDGVVVGEDPDGPRGRGRRTGRGRSADPWGRRVGRSFLPGLALSAVAGQRRPQSGLVDGPAECGAGGREAVLARCVCGCRACGAGASAGGVAPRLGVRGSVRGGVGHTGVELCGRAAEVAAHGLAGRRRAAETGDITGLDPVGGPCECAGGR